jgi:hypothetical protein
VFWTVAALSLLTLLVVYATARSGQERRAAPPLTGAQVPRRDRAA